MTLLYLTGIILSFFLCLLLLIKRGKTRAEKLLLVWMLVLGIHQSLFYFNYSGITLLYPHLLGLDLAFPVLHSVLLYGYVAELTGQKKSVCRRLGCI